MNRKWLPYDKEQNAFFLKMMEDILDMAQRKLTNAEKEKLTAVKERYEKGELSENIKRKRRIRNGLHRDKRQDI